jgi:hypothetical protein
MVGPNNDMHSVPVWFSVGCLSDGGVLCISADETILYQTNNYKGPPLPKRWESRARLEADALRLGSLRTRRQIINEMGSSLAQWSFGHHLLFVIRHGGLVGRPRR